jgi:protoheme IX farnesyltransferase
MSAPTTTATLPSMPLWKQYYVLTKPRVVQLIVFCALIGMVLAVPGLPDGAALQRMLIACIGIWLVAAAAAAFNCLVEKAIDARMRRTAGAPPRAANCRQPGAGVFGAAVRAGFGRAVPVGQPADHVADLRHLRRLRHHLHRHPQAADAAEHRHRRRLGRHAAGAGLGRHGRRGGAEALILFLIIFLWTPPHFWALALYRVEDYRKSGLPMLPVTHGNEFTRLQVLLYTFVLLAACLLPFIYRMSGWLYLVAALVLNAGFIGHAFKLWRQYSDALARKTFRFSLIHLSLLFAALLVDHYLP